MFDFLKKKGAPQNRRSFYEDQLMASSKDYSQMKLHGMFMAGMDPVSDKDRSGTFTISYDEWGAVKLKGADPVAVKSPLPTVEEIHHAFYTEVDRLLAECGIDHSVEAIVERGNRLTKLGFTQAIGVEQAQTINRETSRKTKLRDAILYFQSKYPYKFITEGSVRRICGQYNLVFGTADLYRGSIPEKNLQEIENFKIDQNDEMWINRTYYDGAGISGFGRSTKVDTKMSGVDAEFRNESRKASGNYNHRQSIFKAPLEIVAPFSDMDTRNMQVKDHQLVDAPVPDPIVLQPVMYQSEKYFLIVTAWGPEASDSEVANEKMN